MEEKDSHSISMAACKYSWNDFDIDAKNQHMNRSQFFQYLYILWKEQKKRILGLNEFLTLVAIAMIAVLIFAIVLV